MSTFSRLNRFTFVVAIISLGLFAGCYRSVDRGEWSVGSHLTINVSNIEKLSEVPYTEDGNDYVIRPRNPANLLMVAKVLIVNRKSSRISLLIDTGAAAMLNRNLVRYPAVDPFGVFSEHLALISFRENRKNFSVCLDHRAIVAPKSIDWPIAGPDRPIWRERLQAMNYPGPDAVCSPCVIAHSQT